MNIVFSRIPHYAVKYIGMTACEKRLIVHAAVGFMN